MKKTAIPIPCNMKLELVEPSADLESAYLDYMAEWESTGERVVPGAVKRQSLPYEEYIKEWENSRGKNLPPESARKSLPYDILLEQWEESKTDKAYDKGFVPATLYFLVMSTEDGDSSREASVEPARVAAGDITRDSKRIIGAIQFRHELNEYLLLHGGHIGYGIRPSDRRKGYATLMLGMMLDILKKRSFGKVLITCDDGNAASARTIEHFGGLLENIIDEDVGKTRRYWI
jgi:predicted acetyltransferase